MESRKVAITTRIALTIGQAVSVVTTIIDKVPLLLERTSTNFLRIFGEILRGLKAISRDIKDLSRDVKPVSVPETQRH